MGGHPDPDPTEASRTDQEDGRPKVAIVVEYDGTRYHGFQIQARPSSTQSGNLLGRAAHWGGGETIQSELERVLCAVTQEDCRIVGAGRTDAGVHARGQVAHFKTNWRHPWAELGRALNALLPEDIAVRQLAPVAPEFHARRSARSRRYRYSIWTRSIRSPLSVRYAYHLSAPLDVEALNAAAASLIGTHDFATFGQAPNGGHTIREIHVARWRRDQEWLFFDVEANAFLRRMVRSLVGTLLRVGRGETSPAEFAAILAARERSAAGVTAPPQGLCLERVVYGPPWQELGIETQ